MDYFEFYGLHPSFDLDIKELKKRYIQKSRELHPDFYMDESPEQIEQKTLLSSTNNKAYHILKDTFTRYKYIVENYLIKKSQKLDSKFLMQMMELNEEVMVLSMEYDSMKAQKVLESVQSIENKESKVIRDTVSEKDTVVTDQDILKKIEQFLLKRNYLLRIKENLDKFARS